jgi:hypothetical protein
LAAVIKDLLADRALGLSRIWLDGWAARPESTNVRASDRAWFWAARAGGPAESYMFGQFAPFAGGVCVPLPPAAGAPLAGAAADGAGLAALTIATPPTAIMPTDRSVVAMILRAPEKRGRGAGATGCSAENKGPGVSI